MTSISLINDKRLTPNEIKDINNPSYILSDNNVFKDFYGLTNTYSSLNNIKADIIGINYKNEINNNNQLINDIEIGEKIGEISFDYKRSDFTIEDYGKMNPTFDLTYNTNIDKQQSILDLKNKTIDMFYIETNDDLANDIMRPDIMKAKEDGNKYLYNEQIFRDNIVTLSNTKFSTFIDNFKNNMFVQPKHNNILNYVYNYIKEHIETITYDDIQRYKDMLNQTIVLTMYHFHDIELTDEFINLISTSDEIYSIKFVFTKNDISNSITYEYNAYEGNGTYSFSQDILYIDNTYTVSITTARCELTSSSEYVQIFKNKNIIKYKNTSDIVIEKPYFIHHGNKKIDISDKVNITISDDYKHLYYNNNGTTIDLTTTTIDDEYIKNYNLSIHDKCNGISIVYNIDNDSNIYLYGVYNIFNNRVFKTDNMFNNYIYSECLVIPYFVKIHQPINIIKYPTHNKYNGIILYSNNMKYLTNDTTTINHKINYILKNIIIDADLSITNIMSYTAFTNIIFDMT